MRQLVFDTITSLDCILNLTNQTAQLEADLNLQYLQLITQYGSTVYIEIAMVYPH